MFFTIQNMEVHKTPVLTAALLKEADDKGGIVLDAGNSRCYCNGQWHDVEVKKDE